MDVALKLVDVKKNFGKKKTVFQNVNLEIKQGEIFGIIGMSGSGKTTFLNTLIGFYAPDEGDVLFYSKYDQEYKSVFKNLQEVRRTFGFAAQVPSLYPKLTVRENLNYFGILHKIPKPVRKNNIKVLLDITELSDSENELVQNLSEGMKKRLSIACSLIHNPSVLLLDEPTADLDPLLRKEVWRLIERVHKRGTTIVLASHFLDEIESICHRVAIIHNKEIIPPEKISTLMAELKHLQEILIRTEPGNYHRIAKYLSSIRRIKRFAVKGRHLSIKTEDAEKLLPSILSVCRRLRESVVEVRLIKSNLEELFEEVYSR